MAVKNVVDDYMAGFPKDIQSILEEIRTAIKQEAPNAEETIGYGIPTYKLNGNLVHFAGYKNHIGFYPTPSAIKTFANELSKYKSSKGAVQFPVNKPLPLSLIRKIVQFRLKQVSDKATSKSIKKFIKKSSKKAQ